MTATRKGVAKAKVPTGRPSSFTRAKADRICRELADGITLTEICRSMGIAPSTVWRWGERKDAASAAFRKALARAREAHAHALFHEVIEIADDGRNDWQERQGKNGHTFIALNDEAVQRSRLRVETRLKMIAVLAPNVFGAKITQLLGNAPGADGKEQPLRMEVTDKTTAALEALRAKLGTGAKAA